MKEMHYAVIPNRSAKQQALEVIKRLQAHLPIARAKMKIQIVAPAAAAKKIKAALLKEEAEVEQESWGEPARIVMLIAPGSYRVVESLLQEHSQGTGSLEVIDLNFHREGEHSIDDEITQKIGRLGVTAEAAQTATVDAPASAPTQQAAADGVKRGKQCSTCGGDFGDDVQRYREHFRSEWHRYNLKLKASKKATIDEETFNALDADDIQTFFSKLNDQ
jgi:ribosome maturation protein SDO1